MQSFSRNNIPGSVAIKGAAWAWLTKSTAATMAKEKKRDANMSNVKRSKVLNEGRKDERMLCWFLYPHFRVVLYLWDWSTLLRPSNLLHATQTVYYRLGGHGTLYGEVRLVRIIVTSALHYERKRIGCVVEKCIWRSSLMEITVVHCYQQVTLLALPKKRQ